MMHEITVILSYTSKKVFLKVVASLNLKTCAEMLEDHVCSLNTANKESDKLQKCKTYPFVHFGSGHYSWGFIAGNRRTSWVCIKRSSEHQESQEMLGIHMNNGKIQTLIFWESVSNIVRRSIPKPQPPVGGKPYSRAVQKVSSKAIASSSPDWRS